MKKVHHVVAQEDTGGKRGWVGFATIQRPRRGKNMKGTPGKEGRIEKK